MQELAAAVERPKSSIAYHLGLPAAADLLKVVRTRKVRGIDERYYGRSARIFYVGDAVAEQSGLPPSPSEDIAAESVPARREDNLRAIKRYAWVSAADADRFWYRVFELVNEYAQLPEPSRARRTRSSLLYTRPSIYGSRRSLPRPADEPTGTKDVRYACHTDFAGPVALTGRSVRERNGAVMSHRIGPDVDVIDLEPGLWIWRLEHPAWTEGHDWPEVVTSVCVDAGAERWVLDPLLPPQDVSEVWDRFADRPPTAVAVLIPDHMRETWDDRKRWSVDALARRYGCRAFGPNAFDPEMIDAVGPVETDVQKIEPGRELPGGLVPFRDPRGWDETPLYVPEHRTLVFGDAMTERAGSLRVWMSPTHEERAVPDLRAMLDLPFERVIISHGEPVHPRTAFERALKRRPWPATSLHIAAWRGDVEQVRRLVERGADLSARSDGSEETPLEWAVNASRAEWARKPTHEEIIAYLTSTMQAKGMA